MSIKKNSTEQQETVPITIKIAEDQRKLKRIAEEGNIFVIQYGE